VSGIAADHKKVAAAMRPCNLFNDALDALK
jgi:hypothetical protein